MVSDGYIIIIWLVISTYPSEQIWVEVSWDDDIPNIWKMLQTTNQW